MHVVYLGITTSHQGQPPSSQSAPHRPALASPSKFTFYTPNVPEPTGTLSSQHSPDRVMAVAALCQTSCTARAPKVNHPKSSGRSTARHDVTAEPGAEGPAMVVVLVPTEHHHVGCLRMKSLLIILSCQPCLIPPHIPRLKHRLSDRAAMLRSLHVSVREVFLYLYFI